MQRLDPMGAGNLLNCRSVVVLSTGLTGNLQGENINERVISADGEINGVCKCVYARKYVCIHINEMYVYIVHS